MDFNKLIARVKNILLTPKTEWPVIAAEPDTIPGLFKNYILILAAIPAVIAFLHYSVIGVTVPQPDHADDGCVVTSNTIRGYVGHHDPDLDHRINQLHADARMDCPPARAAAASPAARSTGRRPA